MKQYANNGVLPFQLVSDKPFKAKLLDFLASYDSSLQMSLSNYCIYSSGEATLLAGTSANVFLRASKDVIIYPGEVVAGSLSSAGDVDILIKRFINPVITEGTGTVLKAGRTMRAEITNKSSKDLNLFIASSWSVI